MMKKIMKDIMNFYSGLYNFFNFLVFDLVKLKKAKTVCFFPFYHTGGAEKVHLNIVKALAPQNVCVVFTLNSATENFKTEFYKHAHCIEINSILNKRNSWVNYLLKKAIYTTINNSKHCKTLFGCNSMYYYELLPFISPSIALMDLFHNFFENDSREKVLIDTVSFMSKRIVINEAAKIDMLQFYEKNKVDHGYYSKILIIGNGIELDIGGYVPKSKDIFKIGFLGRWCFEKRPLLFLEIAKKVQMKYPLVSFVMAGTGMKNNLELISEAGVDFLGEITDKKVLNQLYKELNVVLLPSLYEGFPLVAMEAMSYGVITIATKLDGICEHITHGTNGILIDETEEIKIVEKFSQSIFRLIEEENFRVNLSRNSFLYAHDNFSIDKFNKDYQIALNS